MKVAVITSFCKESPSVIQRAHESVLLQTYPCDHIIISDGGMPPPMMDAQTIYLSHNHNNYGDTPKWIGVISALSQGYDAIAFLDADDWLSKNHIENAVRLCREKNAKICVMNRSLNRLDGSELPINYDPDVMQSHCVFMLADVARELLLCACKPDALCEVGDRIMWGAIKTKNIPCAFSEEKTYHYTSTWKCHYDAVGEKLPENAKVACGSKFIEWQNTTAKAEKDYWSRLLLGIPSAL